MRGSVDKVAEANHRGGEADCWAIHGGHEYLRVRVEAVRQEHVVRDEVAEERSSGIFTLWSCAGGCHIGATINSRLVWCLRYKAARERERERERERVCGSC